MQTRRAVLISALLLGAARVAAADSAGAFEARCASALQPVFTINTIQPAYQVDNTVSTRVLHNRSMHNHSSDLMLGMTAVVSRIELGIDGRALRDPASGRECLAPQIDIELRYQPLRVYVAREFSPVGCPFREVLAHELRHVQLYLDHLPKVEALLRSALERRYRGTLVYSDGGEALEVLQKQVDDWLWPLIKAEMRKVELYQAALDTEEESYRLSAACQGELAYNLKNNY